PALVLACPGLVGGTVTVATHAVRRDNLAAELEAVERFLAAGRSEREVAAATGLAPAAVRQRDRPLGLHPASLAAPNPRHGGMSMAGWLKDCLHCSGEAVGLGLEHGAAAAFDVVGPVGQATEKRAHLLADLGSGPEAGVRRHVRTDPAPDRLVGI